MLSSSSSSEIDTLRKQVCVCSLQSCVHISPAIANPSSSTPSQLSQAEKSKATEVKTVEARAKKTQAQLQEQTAKLSTDLAAARKQSALFKDEVENRDTMIQALQHERDHLVKVCVFLVCPCDDTQTQLIHPRNSQMHRLCASSLWRRTRRRWPSAWSASPSRQPRRRSCSSRARRQTRSSTSSMRR